MNNEDTPHTLAEYERMTHGIKCNFCGGNLGTIRHRDHDGGWPVTGYTRLQWLWRECLKCEHEWGYQHLLPMVERQIRTEPKPDRYWKCKTFKQCVEPCYLISKEIPTPCSTKGFTVWIECSAEEAGESLELETYRHHTIIKSKTEPGTFDALNGDGKIVALNWKSVEEIKKGIDDKIRRLLEVSK